MTEPRPAPGDPPPATPLDEAASARLDGEAVPAGGPGADDPEVVARSATFAEVSRVVGAPVDPVTDDQRDAAVAAALGTWDTVREADRAADQLARRRARHRTAKQWLGAAAAVAAIVGFGALVSNVDSDHDDAASDSGGAESATASSAADESGAGQSSTEGGVDGDDQTDQDTAGLESQVARLGSFTSAADLLDAAEDAVALQPDGGGSGAEATAGPEEVERAVTCAGDDSGARSVVALAVLEGGEVAIVADRSNGEVRLQVVRLGDCSVVATRTP